MRTKKLYKNILIFAPLLLTSLIWIWSKVSLEGGFFGYNLSFYFGEIFGLFGFVLLSISYLLSTRFYFIESTFGGLDKVYRLHTVISKTAFIFIVMHPIALAFGFSGNWDLILSLFIFPNTLAKTLGIVSLYMYTLLILISIFRFLPYHIWKYTHRFIGIPFLLGAYHGFIIESDVKNFFPMKLWILFWFFIGVISYIYKVFLYEKFGPKYEYIIEKIVERKDEIFDIYFRPKNRKMNFEPGEFVFVSFQNHNLIPKEQHPFSISSTNSKDYLRISYKVSGDYTKKLIHAKKGDNVYLYGPYGEFASTVLNSSKKQIWISGGIGVTPFLSMLEYESKNEDSKEIKFFYCNKNDKSCVYLDEIQKIKSESDDNIDIHNHISSKEGRITAGHIKKKVGDLKDYVILLCGPQRMMTDLRDQFVKQGVDQEVILFEEFNFV